MFVRIWLPPQFDPRSGTPAAKILKNHLDLFIALNPGVQIEVRIKAEDGPGGLLDSLGSTNVAAPLALLALQAEAVLAWATTEAAYNPREHRYGMFERSVMLPASVQPDKARADFDKGMLTITLPKTETVKPKTVNIKVK